VIAHVRGVVVQRGADSVVVDVNGLGYLVRVPASADVPARGQEVELSTSMVVREDSMTLYGFTDPAARELFELLMGASGVGPKLALAVLSTHRPPVVTRALAVGDVDLLVTVPGIGKKSASRLVLELKDKVGGLGEPDVVVTGTTVGGPAPAPDAVADTREALLQLGYAPGEVAGVLAAIDRDGDASTLLRRALQALAGAS
jgi:Holliday junction DNA helicase RuvA